MKIDSSYGWRIRVYDNNSANGMPRKSTNGDWMAEAPASTYDKIGDNYAQDFHEVHLIANDTTLALKSFQRHRQHTRSWVVCYKRS